MDDLLNQSPPDDSGTDTLQRFRYQAQIAIPFCIDCALRRNVISVIMEHFEDIVVECNDHWHFIQVKSRNADLGPWKIGNAWGGLKSLYRAFKNTQHLEAKYSLFLEGAVASKDQLAELVREGSEPLSEALIKKGIKYLNIEEEECRAFLKVVQVVPEQPSRAEITSHTIRLLGTVATGMSVGEIGIHQERLTDEIFKAMSADRIGDSLYQYISSTSTVEEKEHIRVQAKRLDSKAISDILGSLTQSNAPLLKPIIEEEEENSTQSKLELKLIAGGASERIIKTAKSLRANAASRELEILSSGLFGDGEKLEDAQARVEAFAAAIVERYDEEEKPAKRIWLALIEKLEAEKTLVDPNKLYHQDAFLLLGAVCELSDQCLVDWGVPLA